MRNPHSDTNLMAHAVWATKHRTPLLLAEHDPFLRRLFVESLHAFEAEIVAFGASVDHVHVLVRVPASAPLSDIIKAMKGSSSRRWNQRPPSGAPSLYWQDGYWARSVSPDDIGAIQRYVLRQREHHATSGPVEPWMRAP